MKKGLGFAFASVIALAALVSQPAMAASTTEKTVPTTSSIGTEDIWDNTFVMSQYLSDSYLYNINVGTGTDCNFWLDNSLAGTHFKFKVWGPTGQFLGYSTTSGTQEQMYNVHLNDWGGSGNYKVTIYSTDGSGAGQQYRMKVRNF